VHEPESVEEVEEILARSDLLPPWFAQEVYEKCYEPFSKKEKNAIRNK